MLTLEFQPISKFLPEGGAFSEVRTNLFEFNGTHLPVEFFGNTYLCFPLAVGVIARTPVHTGAVWPVFNGEGLFRGLSVIESIRVNHRGDTEMALSGALLHPHPAIVGLFPANFSRREEFYAGFADSFALIQRWFAAMRGKTISRVIPNHNGSMSLGFIGATSYDGAMHKVAAPALRLEALQDIIDSVSYGPLGRHMGWTLTLPDKGKQRFVIDAEDFRVEAICHYVFTDVITLVDVQYTSDAEFVEDAEQLLEELLHTLAGVSDLSLIVADATLQNIN